MYKNPLIEQHLSLPPLLPSISYIYLPLRLCYSKIKTKRKVSTKQNKITVTIYLSLENLTPTKIVKLVSFRMCALRLTLLNSALYYTALHMNCTICPNSEHLDRAV